MSERKAPGTAAKAATEKDETKAAGPVVTEKAAANSEKAKEEETATKSRTEGENGAEGEESTSKAAKAAEAEEEEEQKAPPAKNNAEVAAKAAKAVKEVLDDEEEAVAEVKTKKAKLYKVKFLKAHEFQTGDEMHKMQKGDKLDVEIHIANSLSQRQIAYLLD